MKEEVVVNRFKDFFKSDGWTVENIIQSSSISGTDFCYIPDILAHKGEDILVGEAKGSEGLRELQTGIGQACTYFDYGGNIIVVVVPEDLGIVAKSILTPVSFEDNGKIGLYVINENGKVKEEIPYKRIRLNDLQKEKGKEKLSKIAFIRDLSVEELKRLLEKMYLIKKNYKTGTELYEKLSKKDKNYIFHDRSTKGDLTIRSFTNTLITTNNLGLTENGKLTPLGISFALTIINDGDEKFRLRLLNLLLINGNFLQILRELEFLTVTQNLSFNEAIPTVIINLKERKLLKESVADIDDFVSRIKANQLRWLKDLGAIYEDNKINWTLVCDAISIST